MREYILFSSSALGITTDHEKIDLRLQRQPASPLSIMDACAYA
jgi:hypothetical protein